MGEISTQAGRVAVFRNPRFSSDPIFAGELTTRFGEDVFEQARTELHGWPGYTPTALLNMRGLSQSLSLGRVWYKDESTRFGLGSFKSLGGAYGVLQALRRALVDRGVAPRLSAEELGAGAYREIISELSIACATDGNHGRGVAWASRRFNVECVVFVHQGVSPGRIAAMSEFGAKVKVVPGTYDDSVRAIQDYARGPNRILVSDTSYGSYSETARDVMAGYTVMVDEIVEQIGSEMPSHLFVQAGVGGLAGALCARLWQVYGSQRPRTIVVQPVAADGFLRSALNNRVTRAPGNLRTVMACLSSAEPSYLGWEVLGQGAFAFMTITDESAIAGMKLLAGGIAGDAPIIAGESGAAGVAALLTAANSGELCEQLQLDVRSKVLLIGTEGATDPAIYASLVAD